MSGVRVLDWLYPPVCMVCGALIPLNKPRHLCGECRDELVYIGRDVCIRCGRAWFEGEVCGRCHGKSFAYDRNIALLSYEGAVREVLHKFKYGGRASFGEGLGEIMAKRAVDLYSPVIFGADYIIPVPLHRNKLRKRGYNQSALLAKAFSGYTGIPVLEDAVIRARDTQPQSLLNPGEKWANVKDAFVFNREYDIADMSIIIIDDIYTTGSTLQAVSKVLKENGAFSVVGVTLSMASARGEQAEIEHSP